MLTIKTYRDTLLEMFTHLLLPLKTVTLFSFLEHGEVHVLMVFFPLLQFLLMNIIKWTLITDKNNNSI